MIAHRKICTNIEDRTTAINFNNNLAHAGDIYSNRIEVPDPEWREDLYSFKLDNVQSYYMENTKEKDIIMNLAYDGVVRMAWSPQLLQVLELKFSTC